MTSLTPPSSFPDISPSLLGPGVKIGNEEVGTRLVTSLAGSVSASGSYGDYTYSVKWHLRKHTLKWLDSLVRTGECLVNGLPQPSCEFQCSQNIALLHYTLRVQRGNKKTNRNPAHKRRLYAHSTGFTFLGLEFGIGTWYRKLKSWCAHVSDDELVIFGLYTLVTSPGSLKVPSSSHQMIAHWQYTKK